MKKAKKKTRYVSPRVTGASALLLDLLCQSVRFNVQVDEIQNVNSAESSSSSEPLYFEF